MSEHHTPDEVDWTERVRIGAELAVVVGTSVLSLLDALDRRRALNTDRMEQLSLLPVPTHTDEEESP